MAIGHIKKGAFHRWLGKPQSEPITASDIAKGRAAGGHPAKMANFAKNIGHAGHVDHSPGREHLRGK